MLCSRTHPSLAPQTPPCIRETSVLCHFWLFHTETVHYVRSRMGRFQYSRLSFEQGVDVKSHMSSTCLKALKPLFAGNYGINRASERLRPHRVLTV